jgi:hypothetical protein
MNLEENEFIEFDEVEEPKNDNRRTILIVAGAVLLVCCCCVASVYIFYQYLGDPLVNWLGF